MLAAKKAEFVRLFQEFVSSYPYTPDGLRHKAAYEDQRQQGRRNFEAIATATNSEEDVTEAVLLEILPYVNTGMLTTILHYLRPHQFLCLNNKSISVINYFTDSLYSQELIDYPTINVIGRNLIQELAKDMHQTGAPSLRDEDLFDMFCHWLVAVKQYDFGLKETSSSSEAIEFNTDFETLELQPEYSMSQCVEETGFTETQLTQWIRTINRKQQAIIQGPPGTGKTFIAQKLAQYLIGGGDGFSDIIQFHPAYSYEDFIQGIRPQSQEGELTYPIVPGRFLEFCEKAEACEDTCILIIDEINRANLSQVFGELMYLLDDRDRTVKLASGTPFKIPTNVRIIGTMNTADRSIALVDNALRRRFAFIPLYPNYELLQNYHKKEETGFAVDKLISILKNVNLAINNKHYELGISFFLTKTLAEDIEDIWQMEIEPYLEEYFFDNLEKIGEFLWKNIKNKLGY